MNPQKANAKIVTERNKKSRLLYFLVFGMGIVFISVSIFHMNIWFDESYSIAIARHGFSEIWSITANDVHPPFYYWMLHLIYIVFGSNILVYRIFSAIGIISTALLGFTHIRKDYGEKTGWIFSVLVLFLPVSLLYANEIRMYSWALFFVTLTFIYAARYARYIRKSDLCLFALFSIIGAYTHYYALAADCVINFWLIVMILIKHSFRDIRCYFLAAVVQIVCYIPWCFSLFSQMSIVSDGFWIALIFPESLYQILGFQLGGNLDFEQNWQLHASAIIGILLLIYLTGRTIGMFRKKEMREIILYPASALAIYFTIIIAMLVVSLFMDSPILYARYLFVITGFLLIASAFIFAKEKRKIFVCFFALMIAGMSAVNLYWMIKQDYSAENMTQIDYLKANIQSGDIIVFSNIGLGGVITDFFEDNQSYFYNPEAWGVEEAYAAYAPQMSTETDLSFLNDFTGRIWLIDSEDLGLYSGAFENNSLYHVLSIERFDTSYAEYIYQIVLMDKQGENQ